MKTTITKLIREGILTKNPVTIQLLGLTPALAVTTSVINAVSMGIIVTAVLICSNLLISLIRSLLPKQRTFRTLLFVAVTGGLTTAFALLMEAFFPELSVALGIFIPLTAVSSVVLSRVEAFATENGPIRSVVDGTSVGVGFTVAIICVALVRELIGTGHIFTGVDGTGGFSVFGGSYPGVPFLLMPAGAFITLGFIIATVQKLRDSFGKKCSDEAAATTDESECTSDNSEEAHENE